MQGQKADIADHSSGQAVEEMLEYVGIALLKYAYPNELSCGELRCLAIAKALIRKPTVILADEPTGDLNDENTQVVLSLLRNAAGNGASVLLVTYEREAAAYADRVYRMDGGVLIG